MSDPARAANDRDFVALVDRWVDQMHDVSQNIVGSSAAALMVCRGVLESLWERRDELTDADLTRNALLLAVRQHSLEHLVAYGWSPPSAGGPADPDELADHREPTDPLEPTDHRELVESHSDSAAVRYRVVLAHAAAAVLGASDTSLVDLHDRHGVDATALEAASADDPIPLAQLRATLGEALAAYTLWNGARPTCTDLAAILSATHRSDTAVSDTTVSDTAVSDTAVFDAVVFYSVERHWRTCTRCVREIRSLVNPAGLFLTARVARVAPLTHKRMLPLAARPFAAWQDDGTPALSAADIEAIRRPGDDDEVAQLWAAAANTSTRPPVPVAPSRRRVRSSTETIMVGAAALLFVVAGGTVLAAQATGGDQRGIVDTPSEPGPPSPGNEEEPEVRSLGPVPPPIEPATGTATSTTTSTTTTSTTISPAAPATNTVSRVPTTAPPRASAATPAPTPAATTTPPDAPATTTTEPPPAAPTSVTTIAETTTTTIAESTTTIAEGTTAPSAT